MKSAVWMDIIAFRLHHHHEIALAFDIEQHLCLSFALGTKVCRASTTPSIRCLDWNTNAQRARQWDLRIFERHDVVDE